MDKEKKERLYKWSVLIVVIIGTFMAVLDSSIVNIAISKMMSVYGVSVTDAQWIITSYTLAMGAVIPLTGYLSDRFGSKKMYIFAMAAFTFGSLLCGIAWSNNVMIISRVIQGLGGGMIMPLGMSIIFMTFPKEERGTALGFWGIAAMAAPTIGPTLGGYIIEYVNWRLIFTLNIPIGVTGVILAILLLKPTPGKKGNSFDFIGFISSAVGLVFLLYVFGEGTVDWSEIKNVIMVIIGVFSFIIFIINELLHPEPLMDLRVFKYIPFSVSMILSTFTTMAMFGVIFIMPLFLQNLRGYSAMQTGIIMFPSAIAMGIMMPIGGKLGDKYGAKPLIIIGSIGMAVTTYILSGINMDTSIEFITIMLVFRAAALGLSMMSASTEGMNSVPHHLISRASAINSTVRQVASSISITFLVGIMNSHQKISYARLSEQINNFNYQAGAFVDTFTNTMMQNGMGSSTASATATASLMGAIGQQAFVSGINATLVTSAMMGVLCVPIAMLFKSKKKTVNEEIHKKDDKELAEEINMEIMMEM